MAHGWSVLSFPTARLPSRLVGRGPTIDAGVHACMSVNSTSTSGSGSSSFNFDGVVSGLNTTSIINAMLAQDKAPLTAKTNQQTKLKIVDAAYQAIKSQLSSFQGSVQALLLSTGVQTKLAASSATGVATATANASAANGSFTLNVINLA